MKRDRSLNDELTKFSVKRIHLQNEIILQNTKQEQYYSERNPNHLNLFDKRNVIEKVQLWLDNIRSANR
jgi:hypothetical protein